MDPANKLEALREVEADISEGADIVMVNQRALILILFQVHSVSIPVAAIK